MARSHRWEDGGEDRARVPLSSSGALRRHYSCGHSSGPLPHVFRFSNTDHPDDSGSWRTLTRNAKLAVWAGDHTTRLACPCLVTAEGHASPAAAGGRLPVSPHSATQKPYLSQRHAADNVSRQSLRWVARRCLRQNADLSAATSAERDPVHSHTHEAIMKHGSNHAASAYSILKAPPISRNTVIKNRRVRSSGNQSL